MFVDCDRLTFAEALQVLGCQKSKFYTLKQKHSFLQPINRGKPKFYSRKDCERVNELEKADSVTQWEAKYPKRGRRGMRNA